jgi:hypothetical protein
MAVLHKQAIKRNINPFDVAKAVGAAISKSFFVKDTFVRNRKNFEKYQRLVKGDMAKLAVKNWLEEKGFVVLDWDDTRKDDWKSQKKEYDLQVNGHNIEVRSSMPKGKSIKTLMTQEHIILPSNVKAKEVNVQVFFSDDSCTSIWIAGWAKKDDLQKNKYKKPRKVGPVLVDFYLMPFSDPNARSMQQLLSYL